MKKILFALLTITTMSAQAAQFICNSKVIKNGKPLDVYHIHTDSKYVKHYQFNGSAYVLLREIKPAKFETSFLETLPGQTLINISKSGYSAYLRRYDNERDFKFTDTFAGHKDFICQSK